MIYFMQAVDGGPIKIGYTKNVAQRHRDLELHYGRKLAVLATMEGGVQQERELHCRFGSLRFGRTEQFRPDPVLMEFIQQPIFAGECDKAMHPRFNYVYIQLTDDEHRRLRIAAAMAEKSVASFTRDAVTGFLNRIRPTQES